MEAAEIVADTKTDLYRWTADEFMGLIQAGLIREPRRVELLDGLIEKTMPQGEIHRFIFRALNRAFAAMGLLDRGVEAIPPVILGRTSAIEPDFGLLRPEAVGRIEMPRERDLLWAIEVSDATLAKDLGRKRRAYAEAGIPHYWVVDAKRRGIWIFSNPAKGVYSEERFCPEGETVSLPGLDLTLDTTGIFPPRPV